MQNVPKLFDEKVRNSFVYIPGALRVNALISWNRAVRPRSEGGRSDELPTLAFIPRPAAINFPVLAFAGGVVEKLVDQLRRRSNFADRKSGLTHAFQRDRKGPHVGDLAGHQKLQGIFRASIPA